MRMVQRRKKWLFKSNIYLTIDAEFFGAPFFRGH